MSRVNARKVAMQLIFERLFGVANEELSIEMAFKELTEEEGKKVSQTADDMAYINDVVSGASQNAEKLDNIIETHLTGWTIKRLSKVDIAILRLSIYEMFYRTDVPNNVSISEAMELAQKYSDPKNARFLNGVLGAISRDKSIEF